MSDRDVLHTNSTNEIQRKENGAKYEMNNWHGVRRIKSGPILPPDISHLIAVTYLPQFADGSGPIPSRAMKMFLTLPNNLTLENLPKGINSKDFQKLYMQRSLPKPH